MTRLNQYLAYHKESARIGDIDPSYTMLRYVADRFELNLEQRYWIAWLYAMTYCGASVFYVYNEFPDYENVNIGRLQRWWDARGRDEIFCQTDRRWVRSSSQFVPAFRSYRDWVGGVQHDHFAALTDFDTPEARYDNLYESARQLYSFGQFSLFLYLEALHTITPLSLCPTDLDLNAAWSCRNGLYYAYGLDNLIEDVQCPIPYSAVDITSAKWTELKGTLAQLDIPPTIWQTETMLCAFRKWFRGKRYIGYYLDRQAKEIAKLELNVTNGVCWDVLWQYREETYRKEHLMELTNLSPKEWKQYSIERTEKVINAQASDMGW